jgi:hypothetical protein
MIELLRAAEEELLDAVGWYEDQQHGLGARFLSEVEKASDPSRPSSQRTREPVRTR